MIETDITLILTLSLIILGSPFLAKILRIPTPPVEIILGALFSTLGFIHHNVYFNLIGEVGFLYLMFLAGMEVNLKTIGQSSKEVLQRASLFIGLMILFSLFFGLLLGFNVVVIVSLPLISIGLLASLSKTYGKEQEWIHLAFIAGALGEIMSITALTIFDAAIATGFSMALLEKVGYLFAFVAMIYLLYRLLHLLFWWMPELKTLLIPKLDTSDQDIRFAMALFFIFITVMLALELELALGAFIAGVGITAFFHHEKRLEEKMSSLGFGFLVPLFFIHVGASFELSSLLDIEVLKGAFLIVGVMLLSRIFAGVVLKEIVGVRYALLVALSLSMPLTLLVAVATIGYETKLMDLTHYYQLILASILEVLFAMTAIKLLKRGEIKD